MVRVKVDEVAVAKRKKKRPTKSIEERLSELEKRVERLEKILNVGGDKQ